MLILAGVTINIVINGGLIGYAQDAKNKTAQSKQDEEDAILMAEYEMAKLTGGTQVTSLGEYKLEKLGLHIGDYVDYSPEKITSAYNPDGENSEPGALTGYRIEEEITDENGDPVLDGDDNPTYTYSSQSINQEILNWRILGYDTANDRILLIASEPTSETLTFSGHTGYNNYETVLNDICKALYSNSSLEAEARSINMNDIDMYLGGSAFNKRSYFEEDIMTHAITGYGMEWHWVERADDIPEGEENYTVGTIYHPKYTIDWTYEEDEETGETIYKGEWTGKLISTGYNYTVSEIITDQTKLKMLIGEEDESARQAKYYVADKYCYCRRGRSRLEFLCGRGWVCRYGRRFRVV